MAKSSHDSPKTRTSPVQPLVLILLGQAGNCQGCCRVEAGPCSRDTCSIGQAYYYCRVALHAVQLCGPEEDHGEHESEEDLQPQVSTLHLCVGESDSPSTMYTQLSVQLCKPWPWWGRSCLSELQLELWQG